MMGMYGLQMEVCVAVWARDVVDVVGMLAAYTFVDVFFLMIRRPPRSTQSRSSAASDVYKRQDLAFVDQRLA